VSKVLIAVLVLLLGLSVAGFFKHIPSFELTSGWKAEYNCNPTPRAGQISSCLCVGILIPESELGKVFHGWPLAYDRISQTEPVDCGDTGGEVNTSAQITDTLVALGSLAGLIAYSLVWLVRKKVVAK